VTSCSSIHNPSTLTRCAGRSLGKLEASEYSDRERAALAWAEAVTLISVHHLPDEVYAEAVRVFSEQELVDLNLAVMSINSWNRLSIAFRYEPERE
jgi:alkylhydroperoxidase family enzyme